MAQPDSFDSWLARRYVLRHGIKVQMFGNGVRGVVATECLEPGRLLLQVPESCLITTNALDAPFSSALKSVGRDMTPLQVLSSFILWEQSKGTASEWGPYLRQLPTHYTSFLSWRQEDIAALQAEHAVQEASEACRALLDEFSAVRTLLEHLKVPTRWRSLTAWQWAASTVASRTMHLPHDEAGALTPFGDLHNYMPPPPPHLPQIPGVRIAAAGNGAISGDGHFDTHSREYRLYTRCAVPAGSQVFLCYGVHTNLQLLGKFPHSFSHLLTHSRKEEIYYHEHYGFQLADNPHDTAMLPRMVVDQVIGQERAQELFPESAALHSCGVPTWHLLQVLRLSAAGAADRRRCGHRAAAGEPITPAAEAAAMQKLHQLCLEALVLLPSSQQSDEAELRAAVAAEDRECLCLALSWRISHKRILRLGLNVATAALEHLANIQGSGLRTC